MQRTREEVAALVKRAADNLRESQQIQQRLLELRREVRRTLAHKGPVKRPYGKKGPAGSV
jgi:hypothetical protein